MSKHFDVTEPNTAHSQLGGSEIFFRILYEYSQSIANGQHIVSIMMMIVFNIVSNEQTFTSAGKNHSKEGLQLVQFLQVIGLLVTP